MVTVCVYIPCYTTYDMIGCIRRYDIWPSFHEGGYAIVADRPLPWTLGSVLLPIMHQDGLWGHKRP